MRSISVNGCEIPVAEGKFGIKKDKSFAVIKTYEKGKRNKFFYTAFKTSDEAIKCTIEMNEEEKQYKLNYPEYTMAFYQVWDLTKICEKIFNN